VRASRAADTLWRVDKLSLVQADDWVWSRALSALPHPFTRRSVAAEAVGSGSARAPHIERCAETAVGEPDQKDSGGESAMPRVCAPDHEGW